MSKKTATTAEITVGSKVTLKPDIFPTQRDGHQDNIKGFVKHILTGDNAGKVWITPEIGYTHVWAIKDIQVSE